MSLAVAIIISQLCRLLSSTKGTILLYFRLFFLTKIQANLPNQHGIFTKKTAQLFRLIMAPIFPKLRTIVKGVRCRERSTKESSLQLITRDLLLLHWWLDPCVCGWFSNSLVVNLLSARSWLFLYLILACTKAITVKWKTFLFPWVCVNWCFCDNSSRRTHSYVWRGYSGHE